jgi:hypothetical protein
MAEGMIVEMLFRKQNKKIKILQLPAMSVWAMY